MLAVSSHPSGIRLRTLPGTRLGPEDVWVLLGLSAPPGSLSDGPPMCGRYTLKTPVERLSEKFQFPEVIPLKPRYNIAPSESVAVVRLLPEDTDRTLAMLRWGLLPAWVKDPAKVQQPINAKAETAAEKPMFRDAFKRRRCLVPADGFYEG